ncbi:MAG: hypothetical protein WBC28_07115, partial [Candidatus Microthrix parvicella]
VGGGVVVGFAVVAGGAVVVGFAVVAGAAVVVGFAVVAGGAVVVGFAVVCASDVAAPFASFDSSGGLKESAIPAIRARASTTAVTMILVVGVNRLFTHRRISPIGKQNSNDRARTQVRSYHGVCLPASRSPEPGFAADATGRP